MSAARRAIIWLAALVGAGTALFSGMDESLGKPPTARSERAPATAVVVRQDDGPSPLVLPSSTRPIRFDHAKHASLGVTCLTCHPRAKTSTNARDRIQSSARACDSCHGVDHRNLSSVRASDGSIDGCSTCHEGFEKGKSEIILRVVQPAPRIRFSHAVHHRRNIGCAQCHGAVNEVGKTTRAQVPRMRDCMTCHGLQGPAQGRASKECRVCHLSTSDGRIQTSFPEGKLVPSRTSGIHHDSDFVHRHGKAAARDSALCASCHKEQECASCHDGRVRPKAVHPGDYLSMHAVDAQQNAARCQSCHQASSFCQSCHMRVGVSQTGPSGPRMSRQRVHPPPSIFITGPRTSRHHATEARRNLSSCVGCHVERDCVGCHSTQRSGGMGASPHPAGFEARCSSAWSRNPRPCLVCHEPGDGTISRCQ